MDSVAAIKGSQVENSNNFQIIHGSCVWAHKFLAEPLNTGDEDEWPLTWMEYMMILKQRTAKVLPSQREWLSKCLEKEEKKEEGEKERKKKEQKEKIKSLYCFFING